MTPAIVQRNIAIAPMSAEQIASVTAVEQRAMACPQVPIKTHHVLHAGMYSRTIRIPAGVVLTGALIKIPTLVLIDGDVVVGRGDESMRITGNAVIPAGAGRKQAFITYQDTTVTMIFPTKATTVEQAEAEFTDDTDMLFSRRDPEFNTTVITGEQPCQEA